MTQDKPTISAAVVQQLLTTAQDSTALLSAPTGLWPTLLQQRLNWLSLWDNTLAPLFESADGVQKEFPLKPQQVTDLLRGWSHGLTSDPQSMPPNSAALMLMGFVQSPQVTEAARHWVNGLLTDANTSTYERVEQGRALAKWFQRWGRKDAELVLLEGLQAASALAPAEQERLVQLGGERWKGQRMQIKADRPRVAQRDRADAHSLERYFKERPEAAQTLLALRFKSVVAANERLRVTGGAGGWSVDLFFNALNQYAQGPVLQDLGLELHRQPITLVDTFSEEACDAALFRSKRSAMTLLLTITHQGGFADIRLATLVVAGDLPLDAYCRRVIQVSDDGESPTEQIARGVVTDAVQAALHAIKATQHPIPGQLAG
jgi:hypothetical protein